MKLYKNKLTLFPLLLISLLTYQASGQDITNTGKFSIGDTVEFHSKVLDENRTLNIYLPQSYSVDVEKKYPVIYLLDGSADEDFVHIAGLVQFGSFSWINMVPESIVVGIANVDRKRDFTFPTKNEQDKRDFPTSGGSAQFIKMLKTEIQPLVDRTYRTSDVKTIIGQSLGGLLVTEILFTQPNLFDNYVIVSPSLWWDDGSLLKGKPLEFPAGTSVFVGVGKEGEVMERVANEVHDKIKLHQPENVRHWFQFFAELDHGDTLHLAVYSAFEKIFARDEATDKNPN